MQSYTSKPITVQAVQYLAPTEAGDDGNIAEIAALVPVTKQTPWAPENAQNCIRVDLADNAEGILHLMVPNSYLVDYGVGDFTVIEADEFEAAYAADAVTRAPANTD